VSNIQYTNFFIKLKRSSSIQFFIELKRVQIDL